MLRTLAGADRALFGERWGSGPVRVVALHGWRRTHGDFSRVIGPESPAGPLASLAPDLPGFGASPPPAEAWGSPEYGELVARLIEGGDTTGPVVVVGHSFGGRVAVTLAARRPDLVAGVVLTGAPVGPRPAGAGRSPAAYRAVRRLRRLGLVGEQRMERARQRYGSEDYRLAEGVMRQVLVRLLAERYEDDLAAVRCPLELVWGDDDTAAPLAMARHVADRVPGATLTVCPGAGHLLPLTRPDDLRAAVDRRLGPS